MHLKCVQIQGSTAHTADITWWVEPAHLSSLSLFIAHQTVFFWLLIHLFVLHYTSFLQKFLPSVREVSPNTSTKIDTCDSALCHVVTAFHTTVCSWHTVTCLLVDVPSSMENGGSAPHCGGPRPLSESCNVRMSVLCQ